ncbi:CMRF35-like molecule 5 [Hoplias malabaricus]|uniref:CMRF35-like molecule 5 n=1 Tax=Hoplias malabaricus TaxID=27720 RepID=UPI0034627C83
MNNTAVALTLLAVVHCVVSAGLRVKALLGGNAYVHCPYDRGTEQYPKYFSKGREKVQIVRKGRNSGWSVDVKYSLKDNTEKMEFTVTIRDLKMEDTGQYWCGVDTCGSDKLTEVILDVVQYPPSRGQASLLHTSPSPFTSRWSEPHLSLATNGDKAHTATSSDKWVYLCACLAVVLLMCGITSAIFIMNKRNNNSEARAIHPACCPWREMANSEHAEDECMRVKPAAAQMNSAVDDETSPPSQIKPHHTVQPCVHPDCIFPHSSQGSNVYEHLRVDSLQDPIYHTLDQTSR